MEFEFNDVGLPGGIPPGVRQELTPVMKDIMKALSLTDAPGKVTITMSLFPAGRGSFAQSRSDPTKFRINISPLGLQDADQMVQLICLEMVFLSQMVTGKIKIDQETKEVVWNGKLMGVDEELAKLSDDQQPWHVEAQEVAANLIATVTRAAMLRNGEHDTFN